MNEEWIENFEKEDRLTATRLFNSLQFFNIHNIESEIYDILKRDTISENYAIYPLMDKKFIKSEIFYLDLLKERKLLFKSKNDNFYNDADSEYVIMNFIRNYCNNEKYLHNMPLRDEYKKLKIRGIIIITDLNASGRQAIDFVNYLIKDKTIKSYISLNLIKEIKIISHLSTDYAINSIHDKKVFSKGKIIKVDTARIARTIKNYFTDYDEQQQIIQLCQKYAFKKKNFLGHGNIGLLSIYFHKTPNNIPVIISQDYRKWDGIIRNRRLRNDIKMSEDTIFINESESNILSAFSLIKKSNKKIEDRLSEFMGISTIQAKSLLLTLINAGYVSSKGYITYEGNKIFKKLSKIDKSMNEIDRFVEKVYYPFYKRGHST